MTKLTAEWLGKAEDDLAVARGLLRAKRVRTDQICFHSQQAIEKYLKAMLNHRKLTIPRTHDIPRLIHLLVATDKVLKRYLRGTKTLTKYAVDYRYPGLHTTERQARYAFRKARWFRYEIRKRLGLRARKPNP